MSSSEEVQTFSIFSVSAESTAAVHGVIRPALISVVLPVDPDCTTMKGIIPHVESFYTIDS